MSTSKIYVRVAPFVVQLTCRSWSGRAARLILPLLAIK